MSFTVPSWSLSLIVLFVVGTCVLTAGCASVQQSTTTGSDTGTRTTARTTGPSNAETSSGTSNANLQQHHWTVTISRIVDGDTVEFRYANGTEDTGRLLGVDTPEVHTENDPSEFEGVPDDDGGRSCLRDWGHKASEFARIELVDRNVTITLDENEGPRGYYGRLLIYIRESDGTSFNYQLVKQGYARVYDSEFTKGDWFYAVEATAQKNDVGLWECANGPVNTGGQGSTDGPTTTRVATDGETNGLAVARIHADADGNDHENLNDEYVVLKNTGGEPIDLSDWSVSDETGHSYRVPDGTTLAVGATVTLHTGGGSDSASDLYWNADSAVWNNGGDTVVVRNADGDMVVRTEFRAGG